MLSVVIPMYNEKAVIAETIRTLTGVLEKTAASYELLLSDDGSTDGCGDLAQTTADSLPLQYGTVRIVRAAKNGGKGAALRNGILASAGEIVLFTDSDLAYGADIIPVMAETLRTSNNDLLIGSRAIHPDGYRDYTFLRKLASKTFVRLLALTAGFHHSDSQCGIKAFRGDTARDLFARCETNGWAFDFEILLLAQADGLSVAEYPVVVLHHGDSKVHLIRDTFGMLRDVRRIKKRVRRRT